MYTVANDSTLTPLLLSKVHVNKGYVHDEIFIRILKLCKSNLNSNTLVKKL